METLGFIFGLIGMSLGIAGFVCATICLGKLNKLIISLKDRGLLADDLQQT